MRAKSLISQLILFISIAFFLLNLLILFFTHKQITKVIDSSQKKVFSEKLHTITASIDRQIELLEKTGMVEVYEDDFKERQLETLRRTYCKSGRELTAPVIFDADGNLLLHSEKLEAGAAEIHKKVFQKILEIKNGDFTLDFAGGSQFWYIVRPVDEWGWYVLFEIPLQIKHRDVAALLKVLIPVTTLLSFLTLLFVVVFLRKSLQPITALTKSATQIAAGDLEQPIAITGRYEIATLCENFSLMRDSIRETIWELEDSRNNLDITLNSIGDAVIATDKNGKITRINQVAEKLTGWSAKEALGESLESVFSIVDQINREPIANPAERVFSQGETLTLESSTLLICRDGTEYLIDDSAAPIRNESGEMIGIVLIFRDITEQKSLENQLQQSRKMDAIGQLAGGVAHDFNNMLAGILGAAELLKIKVDQKHHRMVDLIINAAERAAQLTEKLLSFSRKGKVESTPIDVHLALDSAIAILERSIDKRISLKTNFTEENSNVIGDLSQLQNVFLNLGINASHAIAGEGEIVFSTEIITLSQEQCGTSSFEISPGAYIQVSVRDTGCGIPIENLQKIFEPFFTTKSQGKGTGLGLAAAYGAVHQHKGSISVYSEIDKGSVFNIYLPLTDAEMPVDSVVENVTQGQGTILLIDDELIIRSTAELMLQRLGYTVLLGEDGADGLAVYLENRSEIDLVILDMIMPKMDGRECFHKLKQLDPDVKIILASGFSRESDLDGLKEDGLKGFLRKPFRMSELSSHCTKFIVKKPSAFDS